MNCTFPVPFITLILLSWYILSLVRLTEVKRAIKHAKYFI